jgi:hypothetical protein
MFESANTAIREAVATSNPEAVARFFDHICKAVINGLLASNSEEFGIFGQVSNHFGVVETNGRGMLHLHALVWLRGNLAFTNLRDRLLTDSQFAARMIHYLESIIIQGIDESILPNSEVNTAATPPSTNKVESDDEFLVRLCHDANSVAYKKQMHSKNHLAGCFKYGRKASGKNTCRFGMPRDLLSTSMVHDVGNIHIARNHPWINPWNPAIASCIRSNQDISWIPTVSKCLALMYYLTNYATKDDVSPWQILAKTALLKQSIDQAKLTEHPTATEVRLRDKGKDNFALRCFNTLSRDREISGVQVASTLLQLPTFYTVNDNAVRVNLWWLRRYIRTIVQSEDLEHLHSLNPITDEPCTYHPGDTVPVSIFENYKWRSPHLESLNLFEYCMLVRTKNIQDAILGDIDFDEHHPRYNTHVQRLARTQLQVATVTFSGQLTEFQPAEDAVPGGHPETEAILNDIAEILLGLFVPWNRLLALFVEYRPQHQTYTQIWQRIEQTLTPYNQNFARNIELLRKSKEDAKADAKLRRSTNRSTDEQSDHDIDEVESSNLYADSEEEEESFHLTHENFDAETLIAAYHSIDRM